MKFSDIPGHEKTKDALRLLADSGKMPHALMISGPSGIGKMMLARAFMQYAHCEAPVDGEPCGQCQSCRQHLSFNHPDTHFIFPVVKSESKKIYSSEDRIEQWQRMLKECPEMIPERWLDIIDAGNSQPSIYVRDSENIIRAESYSSFNSKYKFFTIWLPEKMRPEAANKLLKVIEEPTEGTVFILVSNNEAEVLPTIFSRTRRFNLLQVEDADIRSFISSHYQVSDLEMHSILKVSAGRVAKAIELATHSGERDEFGNLFRLIMRSAYAKQPAKLREIGDAASTMGREKLRRFLLYMTDMARENFIYNLRMPQLSAMTREEENFSSRFSPFIHHGNVEEMVEEISQASTHIGRNANSKVVLFSLFLKIIPLLHRPAPK